MSNQLNAGPCGGSYTKAFGDGPRYFETWSSKVDDIRAGNPSPNYHTTPTGRRFSSRQIYRASLPYTAESWVQNLELLMTLRVERLIHVKSVEAQSPPVGVVSMLGTGYQLWCHHLTMAQNNDIVH
ncbi:hypothetical protein TNCV_4741691 [Trichonephila clavipes]|nr:hypothetical protein TNCV_4741691 [Trichonephila clavipes]